MLIQEKILFLIGDVLYLYFIYIYMQQKVFSILYVYCFISVMCH